MLLPILGGCVHARGFYSPSASRRKASMLARMAIIIASSLSAIPAAHLPSTCSMSSSASSTTTRWAWQHALRHPVEPRSHRRHPAAKRYVRARAHFSSSESACPNPSADPSSRSPSTAPSIHLARPESPSRSQTRHTAPKPISPDLCLFDSFRSKTAVTPTDCFSFTGCRNFFSLFSSPNSQLWVRSSGKFPPLGSIWWKIPAPGFI